MASGREKALESAILELKKKFGDGTIMRLGDATHLAVEVIPTGSLDRFFNLARAGFSQKRKKLRNSLSAGLHIPPEEAASRLQFAGIDPGRRAETLSLEEWKVLVISLD